MIRRTLMISPCYTERQRHIAAAVVMTSCHASRIQVAARRILESRHCYANRSRNSGESVTFELRKA